MANPEKRKVFGVIKNLSSVVSEALHSKTISMIILLAIIAAVPLTVIVAQKQQEIRQQASGGDCTCSRVFGFGGNFKWQGDGCSAVGIRVDTSCTGFENNQCFRYRTVCSESDSRNCGKPSDRLCGNKCFYAQQGTSCEYDSNGLIVEGECDDGEVCRPRSSPPSVQNKCDNKSPGSTCNTTNNGQEVSNGKCALRTDVKDCVTDWECTSGSSERTCQSGKTCDNISLKCIESSSVCSSNCDDDNPCTWDGCDTYTGTCGHSNKPKLADCGNAKLCDEKGQCSLDSVCVAENGTNAPRGSSCLINGVIKQCDGQGHCNLSSQTQPRPECTNESGCSSDKRCEDGRCVPRGTGGVGSCTGDIVSKTCENGRPKTLKVKYNVSPKAGFGDNTCHVFVVGPTGEIQVKEDDCTDGEEEKDLPITQTGEYKLYVSSGGSEGDPCYNEEKDPPFNVTCDSPAPRDPEPTTGNPPNPGNPPGTGVGQGISCKNNPPGANPPSSGDGRPYIWKAECGGITCSSNTDCAPNNFDVRNVNPETSNWCYGFTPQWKCMKLVKQGCENGTEASCTGSCTAESLQPRFRVEGVLGGNWFPDPRLEGTPRVEANTDVNLAVFKNNQQTFAGAGVRARITGPGIDRDVKTDRVDSFKPTQSGTYTLSVACGTARHNTSVTLQVGAAGSVCRTAESLQPRFQKNVSTPWEETLTNINIGESVRVAVFKNGDTNYAGAGTTAKITGPNNFKRENVSTTAIETFVPTAGGDYILESTCGPITQRATLKVDAIQECKPEKVDMTAKSVKTLSSTDIFVNEDIKFVIMGEQGQTQKRDEWAPAGIVNCTGGFFGSKTCQASSSGTLTWKHFWKNCAAGSETNCRTEECVKPLNVTVKAIPNFAVSGNVSSDSGRLIGMPGLTVKIKNDETNATASATTDNNGNFAFQALPRGSRYTLTVEAYPRFGGKEYYSSSNYPVHFALLEDKTTDSKKIKIVFKEKTATTKIPIGRITAGNCDTPVTGYACIPGDEAKLNIEIRDFNGNRILRETADDDGGDEQCQTPMHGFRFDVPVELRDGAEHSVALRAINPGAGPNTEFEGSPFTFTCSNPADLDNDDDVDAMDYNIIWNRYHDQTPLVECSGTNRAPICRYANAQGKIDLRGFAKWMVDAYSFLK